MGSVFKLSWDLLHFLTVIYMFLWIPLYLAFEDTLEIGGLTSMYGGLLIFLLDIVIYFNTAYYEKGLLVISREKIFKNYFLSFLNTG